jgi:Glycosyltransferase family 87
MTLEPMYHTFFLGQVNLILLALILTDIWRVVQGRPAGVLIGIAAAIKLTPLIFVALLLSAGRTRAGLTAALTFASCGLLGYVVAPGDSRIYWQHRLFTNTGRFGAQYISNQSPYATALRLSGGAPVGHWFVVIPALLGVAGLGIAVVLARAGNWLGATATTGTTGLLVSPISWTHHWVWILPALVILLPGGRRSRIAAACTYLLFVAAPMWFTPRSGGHSEFGFHWLVTLVANCYLVAGLAFLGYMGWKAAGIVRGAGPPLAPSRPRVPEPAASQARDSRSG